ncbi:MAG: helix-turn-helix transcriptional regulator [Burkholderiaceae bacterium]|nr:helix-turn-helix transcriptional regulator [Burkholderiaceae bacterium]
MSSKTSSAQKSLGLRIKELRAVKAITQEELAERCGMFRTYMSRIESGLANPTLTALYTLADALQVDVVDLFVPAKASPTRVRAARPISRGRAGS